MIDLSVFICPSRRIYMYMAASHFPNKKFPRSSFLRLVPPTEEGTEETTRGERSEEARYNRHGTIAPQERHVKRRPFPDPKRKADTPPQQLICVCCSIYTQIILA